MVLHAELDIVRNFVTELQPLLVTVDIGIGELAAPDPDPLAVSQALDALATLRGASSVLALDGLVALGEALSTGLETVIGLPAATAQDAPALLRAMVGELWSYADGLAVGEVDGGCVERALAVAARVAEIDRGASSSRVLELDDLDELFGDDTDASPGLDVTQPAGHDAVTAFGAALLADEPSFAPVAAEVHAVFLEEAAGLLRSYSDTALALVLTPNDVALIVALRRDAHTLKGAAGMTGYPLVGLLGAAVEAVLDAQLDSGRALTSDTLDLVMTARRLLSEMLLSLDDLTPYRDAVAALQLRADTLARELLASTLPSLADAGTEEDDDPGAEASIYELASEIAGIVRLPSRILPHHETIVPSDLDGLSRSIDAISAAYLGEDEPASPMPASLAVGPLVDLTPDFPAATPDSFAQEPSPADDRAVKPLTDLLRFGPALLDLAARGEMPIPATTSRDSLTASATSNDDAWRLDVLETFQQEAGEHLDVILRGAMALERDPAAVEALREVYRSVHTLKGAAAAAGLDAVSECCHTFEDELDALLQDGLTSDRQLVSRLLALVDDVERLIAVRRAELTGERLDATAAPIDTPATRLRVDSGRIDGLLNLVGELAISRGAYDQRLQRFAGVLGELGLTAERLRRSSRQLEQRAGEAGAPPYWAGPLPHLANGNGAQHLREFDPLEMERYTEVDRLVRELAEVAADVGAAAAVLSQLRGDLDSFSDRQRRLTTALQDELMDVRMVPFGSFAPRLYQVVQRIAQERGKDVELVLEGRDTRLDKLLLEALSDALLHLLRNAVDHGIETPAERLAAGKLARGTVRVRAWRDGSQAVIEVADDGRGIDHGRLLQRARELGFDVDDELRPEDALRLVLLPGLSVRDAADDVSGRGIGMDVVNSAVTRLKGTVAIDSLPGIGTVFALRLPVMFAVAQAFIVVAEGQRYAVPLGSVELVVDRRGQRVARLGSATVLQVNDVALPLVDLGERMGARRDGVLEREDGWLLISRVGTERYAVRVDGLEGQQEVVVKPLGRFLKQLPGLVGATILGTGATALILDVPRLLGVSRPAVSHAADAAGTLAAPVTEGRVALVVDDSLSVRRVLSLTLERHGWTTLQARDGVEALDVLDARRPDVIVTDIEMPRMDGFDLIAAVRRRPGVDATPIVMLTSRAGGKHRAKAFELGANAYLVKPFQEQELVETLEQACRAQVRAAS